MKHYDTDSGLSPEDDKKIDQVTNDLNSIGCNRLDVIMVTLLLGVIFELREDISNIESKLDKIIAKDL